jgi:glutamate/tyrosine decarboxylase-like PLP-dependent enzyme
MWVPLINQNMCNQDIQAPSATLVEMEVVHWLRQQLGYPVPSAYTTVTEIRGVLTVCAVSQIPMGSW